MLDHTVLLNWIALGSLALLAVKLFITELDEIVEQLLKLLRRLK